MKEWQVVQKLNNSAKTLSGPTSSFPEPVSITLQGEMDFADIAEDPEMGQVS